MVFDNKWVTGSLVAARCGGSRFQNGSGSGEDAARALVWNFLFSFQPVLDVATAEFRTVEAKRFATDECHGFRFDLADMHGGLFAIHQLFGGGMPENDVGYFVEGRFMRECGDGAYGDFACSRKALNVAIYLVKWRARDIQGAERRVDVKAACKG